MQLLRRGLKRDQPITATCMIKYTDRLGRRRCKGGPDLRTSQHYPDSFGAAVPDPVPNLHLLVPAAGRADVAIHVTGICTVCYSRWPGPS